MSTVRERPSVILRERRAAVLDLVRRSGASNVRVFGSVARGEDRDTSDVDLLVDFPEGATLIDVIALEQKIRELLGIPVDVGPADALRADIRDEVLAQARCL